MLGIKLQKAKRIYTFLGFQYQTDDQVQATGRNMVSPPKNYIKTIPNNSSAW